MKRQQSKLGISQVRNNEEISAGPGTSARNQTSAAVSHNRDITEEDTCASRLEAKIAGGS